MEQALGYCFATVNQNLAAGKRSGATGLFSSALQAPWLSPSAKQLPRPALSLSRNRRAAVTPKQTGLRAPPKWSGLAHFTPTLRSRPHAPCSRSRRGSFNSACTGGRAGPGPPASFSAAPSPLPWQFQVNGSRREEAGCATPCRWCPPLPPPSSGDGAGVEGQRSSTRPSGRPGAQQVGPERAAPAGSA